MKKIIDWLKNYAYFYKLYAVAAVIIIGIIFGICWQVTHTEKYDYTVYLCLSENTPSELLRSVKASVAQYGEDVDGDGKVNIRLIDLSYDFMDPKSDSAMQKKTLFAGELGIGGHYIYFYDKDYYDDCLSTLFEKNSDLSEMNGTACRLSDLNIYEYIRAGLDSAGFNEYNLPEMYVSLKKAPDESDKKQKKIYDDEKQLFQKIVEDKKK